MLILALDTSSASGSLALLRDATILACRVSSVGEPYSASLLRETKEFRWRNDDSGVLDRLGDEVVTSAEEFLQSLRPQLKGACGLLIACTEPEVIRSAMEGQDLGCCRIEVVSNVLAPFIGQLGYAKAVRGDVVDALHLDANYIRRSDAEMNWKGG